MRMSRRGILKTLLATPLAALFGPKVREEAKKVYIGADVSKDTDAVVSQIFWREVRAQEKWYQATLDSLPRQFVLGSRLEWREYDALRKW